MSTLPAAEPMSPRSIREVDRLVALVLIATRLREIPELARLLEPRADELAMALEVVQPAISGRWAQLSPEGRGAVIAAGSPGFFLQPEDAQAEASSYFREADRLMKDHVEGKLGAYRVRIAELLAPLRVEGLQDAVLVVELKQRATWDLFKDSSPLAGPSWDGLESALLRAFADIGPAAAAALSPGKIQARAQRKLGSLSHHLKTHDLSQRIDLWIQSQVFGKSAVQIASEMQEAGAVEPDGDPGDRVRKHISDMNRLLGSPARGRTEPGAFVRWKHIAN